MKAVILLISLLSGSFALACGGSTPEMTESETLIAIDSALENATISCTLIGDPNDETVLSAPAELNIYAKYRCLGSPVRGVLTMDGQEFDISNPKLSTSPEGAITNFSFELNNSNVYYVGVCELAN